LAHPEHLEQFRAEKGTEIRGILNVMGQVTDQEPDGADLGSLTSVGAMVRSEPDLTADERAKISRWLIELCCTDQSSDMLDEQVRRLERTIGTANRAARSQHWKENADRALQAAAHYQAMQTSATPVSLADVATRFQTSERSVSRYIKQLKNQPTKQN
jgi:hypothetical protein